MKVSTGECTAACQSRRAAKSANTRRREPTPSAPFPRPSSTQSACDVLVGVGWDRVGRAPVQKVKGDVRRRDALGLDELAEVAEERARRRLRLRSAQRRPNGAAYSATRPRQRPLVETPRHAEVGARHVVRSLGRAQKQTAERTRSSVRARIHRNKESSTHRAKTEKIESACESAEWQAWRERNAIDTTRKYPKGESKR
eukprot:6187378-Pleurochrysis_carterae.AAC.4